MQETLIRGRVEWTLTGVHQTFDRLLTLIRERILPYIEVTVKSHSFVLFWRRNKWPGPFSISNKFDSYAQPPFHTNQEKWPEKQWKLKNFRIQDRIPKWNQPVTRKLSFQLILRRSEIDSLYFNTFTIKIVTLKSKLCWNSLRNWGFEVYRVCVCSPGPRSMLAVSSRKSFQFYWRA